MLVGILGPYSDHTRTGPGRGPTEKVTNLMSKWLWLNSSEPEFGYARADCSFSDSMFWNISDSAEKSSWKRIWFWWETNDEMILKYKRHKMLWFIWYEDCAPSRFSVWWSLVQTFEKFAQTRCDKINDNSFQIMMASEDFFYSPWNQLSFSRLF